MEPVDQIEILVLDAVSDDFENLEQIYRSISFVFSSENFDANDLNSFYLRPAANAPLLAEIADAIKRLTDDGLVETRAESGETLNINSDLTFVWRAWFRITKEGMTVLHKGK